MSCRSHESQKDKKREAAGQNGSRHRRLFVWIRGVDGEHTAQPGGQFI